MVANVIFSRLCNFCHITCTYVSHNITKIIYQKSFIAQIMLQCNIHFQRNQVIYVASNIRYHIFYFNVIHFKWSYDIHYIICYIYFKQCYRT